MLFRNYWGKWRLWGNVPWGRWWQMDISDDDDDDLQGDSEKEYHRNETFSTFMIIMLCWFLSRPWCDGLQGVVGEGVHSN